MTAPVAFLQNLNAPEIIMIFAVVLLFFGAKRLPELFRSLGKSVKEFKKATQGIEDDIRSAMDADDEPEKPVAKRPIEQTQPSRKDQSEKPTQPVAAEPIDSAEGGETDSKRS